MWDIVSGQPFIPICIFSGSHQGIRFILLTVLKPGPIEHMQCSAVAMATIIFSLIPFLFSKNKVPFLKVSISGLFNLNLTFCSGSISLWPECYFCFAGEETVITHILDPPATSRYSIRGLMRVPDTRAAEHPQWFHRWGSQSRSYSTDFTRNRIFPVHYFICCFQRTVFPGHERTIRDKEMGWGPKARWPDEGWSLGLALLWSITRWSPFLGPLSLSQAFHCLQRILMIPFWGVRRGGEKGGAEHQPKLCSFCTSKSRPWSRHSLKAISWTSEPKGSLSFLGTISRAVMLQRHYKHWVLSGDRMKKNLPKIM